MPDGTAAAPGLPFAADPDTGVWRPADNQIGLATAGVSRWYVDENGHMRSGVDATYDIGSSGASARPRTIYASTSVVVNGLMILAHGAGGGHLQFTRKTSTPAAPGAASAAIVYFRDGTNANTLKLVVRAGTAGVETTVLDNIPTT